METEKFEEWVILEVFGHRRLAGKATESAILGGALLRLDIPADDRNGNEKFTTQFIGPASIFSMTPTTEAIARRVAIANQPEPVNRWEFPQITEKSRQFVPVDPFPDDPGDQPCGSDFKRDDDK